MKPPLAKCPKCKGTGKFPIGSGLQETLDIIRRKGALSAVQIYKLYPSVYFGVTAINQRLEDLRKLELVSRQRKGKSFVYFINSPD